MRLYSVPHSPFAARVLIALRYKGIACELLMPGDMRSPEYLSFNPIGKLPVLIPGDGFSIPESETIIQYLDEVHPDPALMPANPRDRARVRTAIRVLESYVTPALARLFAQLDPATRDPAILDSETKRLRGGLDLLSLFVDGAPFVFGNTPTQAECMVFPTLQICNLISHMFALGNIVEDYPALANYYRKAGEDTVLGGVRDEVAAALLQYQQRSRT